MGKNTNTAYAFDYTLLTQTIDDFAIDIESEDNTDSESQSTDNQQITGF